MFQIEMPEGCTGRVQSMVLEIQRDGVRVGWIMTTDGKDWIAQRVVERDPRGFLWDIVDSRTASSRDEAIAFAAGPPPVRSQDRIISDTNQHLEN